MSRQRGATKRAGIVLPPGGGRAYPMGRIAAVFKADGAETDEPLLDLGVVARAEHQGPGRAPHPEDDVFYVSRGR